MMRSETVLTILSSDLERLECYCALTTAGFVVMEAVNWREGLQKACFRKIDAILMDEKIAHEYHNGDLRVLRSTASNPAVPVLLLAGTNGHRSPKLAQADRVTVVRGRAGNRADLIEQIRRVTNPSHDNGKKVSPYSTSGGVRTTFPT